MKQQILEEENRQLKAKIKSLHEGTLEKLDSSSLIKAIEAYSHWLLNADSDFIEKAWKDNQWMAYHLKSKLNRYIVWNSQVLAHFDRELDDTNREILYRYILENHINKW